jgi:hemolysin activation/secretion protein
MIHKTHCLVPLLAAVAASTAPLAQAQTVPDAGRVQREAQPPTLQPPTAVMEIRLEPAMPEQTPPGGPKVTIRQVEFTGNTLISTEKLKASLADQMGRSLDLAGLRAMAQQVSALYQASGYPFARAFLLPQTVQDGVIKLGVLEGRYGQVKAEGDTKLAAQAQPFLQELKPGQVIETGQLSRSLLLLGDQPGIQVTPLVRPGQETGTGDLMVTVSPTPLVRVDAGYDNHGTRYTGANRVRFNAQFDSPFSLGDQVFARWVYSDGNLWLGSLSYGRPLGYSGLRMTANASRTAYWLGKDFASLDASGTADTQWLSLSYPLVRTTTANATLGASLQRKQLRDIQRAVQTDERKSSQSLPLSLQFDRRDDLGGSGITYGSVSWTVGDLRLQGQGLAADTASGRSAHGSFSKWNLDLARVQSLGSAGLSLFVRLSAQQANQNLDSSEKFSLGGPSGVRAFPIGEGNGDSGAYAQVELRASMGAFSPYAFFDTGRATLNARNGQLVAPLATNSRSVAGAGAGVRFRQESWDLDGVVAHQTRGGAAQSELGARATRAWVTVTYRF